MWTFWIDKLLINKVGITQKKTSLFFWSHWPKYPSLAMAFVKLHLLNQFLTEMNLAGRNLLRITILASSLMWRNPSRSANSSSWWLKDRDNWPNLFKRTSWKASHWAWTLEWSMEKDRVKRGIHFGIGAAFAIRISGRITFCNSSMQRRMNK